MCGFKLFLSTLTLSKPLHTSGSVSCVKLISEGTVIRQDPGYETLARHLQCHMRQCDCQLSAGLRGFVARQDGTRAGRNRKLSTSRSEWACVPPRVRSFLLQGLLTSEPQSHSYRSTWSPADPFSVLSSQSCSRVGQMVWLSLCLWLPPGHQDLPEEEELSDIQLPTVFLPVRHAGPALREPV